MTWRNRLSDDDGEMRDELVRRSSLDRAFDSMLDAEHAAGGIRAPAANVEWGTPNVEAAAYQQRGPGLFGKILGAIGLDASGRRSRTSWNDAAETTAKGTSATNIAHGAFQAGKRLLDMYQPGLEGPYREQAPIDALQVASTAGTGAIAAGGAQPTGSLGTFIGRPQAKRLAEYGRPAAQKALDLAESMEAKGASYAEVRAATNSLIEAEDAKLGGVTKSKEGPWLVELDDSQSKFRNVGPRQSTLGKELSHPELYQADPGLADVSLRRVPGEGGAHMSADPELGRSARIDIGMANPSRRSIALHEAQHELDTQTPGLSHGADPSTDISKAISPLEQLGAIDKYARNAGEARARNVEARQDLSARGRRESDPIATEDVPRADQIISHSNEGRAASVAKTARNDEIVKAINDGEATTAIAERYGISRGRVLQIFDAAAKDDAVSIKRSGRHVSPIEEAEIVEAIRNGTETRRLQLDYNLGYQTVRRIARRNGVDLQQGAAQTEQKISDALRSGAKPNDLAAEHSLTRPTIYNIAKRNGDILRERMDERNAAISRLRAAGKSYHEIANELNISRDEVGGAIKALELQQPRSAPEVGRGRKAETFLDDQAMELEKQIRRFEDAHTRGGKTPQETADAVNRAFDQTVTAEDIASGNVWWRIGEKSDLQYGTISGDTQREGSSGKVGKSFWETLDTKDFESHNDSELGVRGLPLPTSKSEEDSGVQKIVYAGPKSKTADKEALREAQDMKTSGANRDEIWLKTGWGQRGDGSWIYDINDAGSHLTDKAVEAIKQVGTKQHTGLGEPPSVELPLSKVLAHQELFKAYPSLKNLTVRFEPMRQGMERGWGYFVEGENGEPPTIAINVGRHYAVSGKVLETLRHELQHALQTKEKVGYGGRRQEGASMYDYMTRGREVEARRAEKLPYSSEKRPWKNLDLPESEADWKIYPSEDNNTSGKQPKKGWLNQLMGD